MRGMTQDATTNRRRNLGYFFDRTVERLPDKVAIIDLFGGRERTSTYRQLDERSPAYGVIGLGLIDVIEEIDDERLWRRFPGAVF